MGTGEADWLGGGSRGGHSEGDMKNILFICGKNRLRSPTAEHIFSQKLGLEVASAGIDRDADEPVSGALLEWAEVVFVMEKSHLTKLRGRFGKHLNRQRVICLGIKDQYEYMDPELVQELERKVEPHVRRIHIKSREPTREILHRNRPSP